MLSVQCSDDPLNKMRNEFIWKAVGRLLLSKSISIAVLIT